MAKRIISTTVRDSEDKSAIIDYKTAIPYQQGKYDPTVTYVRNEISYPIVKYGELYYYLNLVGEHKLPAGETPASNYALNGADATWVLADNFKVLMADIAFAEFAKMGSFIFDKNRMMSSQGSTDNYTDANFIPNFEVDGETGLMKFGKNIQFGMKDGYAVLEYYDNDGQLLYDLGPNGISEIEVREESWTEVKLHSLSTSSFGYAEALSKPEVYKNGASYPTTYYRYNSKIVAGVYQDPTNDGKIFPSQDKEGATITGIFCAATNGHFHGIAGGPYPSDYHPDNPAIQWTSSYIIWSQPLLIYNGGAETIGKRYSAYWTVLREGYPEI